MNTGWKLAALGALTLAAMPVAAQNRPSAVQAGVEAWDKGDYKTAVDIFRTHAISGDADAQFDLAQAYKLGRGVPVDLQQAELWYAKSAAQGHPMAEINYGLALFENGKRAESVPWLQKAVARGEPRAQFVYGTMLFNGDNVPKDWVRAYALMTRASAAGIPQAARSLGQMDQYISLPERQQGLELARAYESEAARPQFSPELAGPRTGSMQSVDLPPSDAGQPDRRPTPPRPRPTPKPPVEVVQVRPPVQNPPVTGKGWRVQLGAFRDEGNARNLWQDLKGRVGALGGLQPYLVKSGTLTKLQAGPLGSGAEAARACAAVKPTGTPCVPVPPGS
ncbi:hypothetical protein BH09PSE4_BH09PSE4_11840 [soil metagenome]